MSSLSSAPSTSSSAPNASTKGTNLPKRGLRTSPPGPHTPPPTVMPDGDDIVLLDRVKEAGPQPPSSTLEDPGPPKPQPQSESESESEPEPEPEPDPAAIAAEAENLKVQGNESFKRARYGEAVDLYTKAIGMFCVVAIIVTIVSPFSLTSSISTKTC